MKWIRYYSICYFPGHGGTSTTGNVGKAILLDLSNRKHLVAMVPEPLRSDFSRYCQDKALMLRFVLSSALLDVSYLEEIRIKHQLFISQSALHFILENETTSKLTHHLPEAVLDNNCHGFNDLSEEFIEVNQKVGRNSRINLSRKSDNGSCLLDTIRHLKLSSDVNVRDYSRSEIGECRHCGLAGYHRSTSCPWLNKSTDPAVCAEVKLFLDGVISIDPQSAVNCNTYEKFKLIFPWKLMEM